MKEPAEFLEIHTYYCEHGCTLNITVRVDGTTTVTGRSGIGTLQAEIVGTFSDKEIDDAIHKWQAEHLMHDMDYWDMRRNGDPHE